MRRNPSASVSAFDISTPMRLIRSDGCARANKGHDAAPPTSAMNSRRPMGFFLRLSAAYYHAVERELYFAAKYVAQVRFGSTAPY
jgi:hypothetical protein